LIYLAGGMASGKGYVLEYLVNHGYLGLENAVYINPDYFAKIMPEFEIYRSEGAGEGAMTHKESGYMEELALWEALRRGSHIVEDGSLRDAKWFAGDNESPGLISLIKEKYPMYRVAVIWIDLVYEGLGQKRLPPKGKEEVLRRLAKRAAEERTTDEDLALSSYDQCETTVEALVRDSVADFAVRIDNSNSKPGPPKVVSVAGTSGWGEPVDPEDPNKVIGAKLGPAALAKVTTEQIKRKGRLYNGAGVGLSLADSAKRIKDYQEAVAQAWPTLLAYDSGALPRDETVPVDQVS